MSPPLTPAQIAAALGRPFQRNRVSPLYRLGLLFVTLVMVLLPLVYLALIGLTGTLVTWHAVSNAGIFKGVRGRASIGILIVYLAPIVIGAILIVFMIKPLFARAPKDSKPLSVNPSKEPLLAELLRRLCAAVGAPMPREIRVNCDVNASAGLRRGLWSLFSRDLVLTIGLPLVAGLSLRQFVGVLAHEFGHFAQGTGMRLSSVVFVVNRWFARVVYERDALDEQLVEWSQSVDLRIGWMLYLARLFVWLTRRVLWLLMVIGNAVSTFFLRQMEYDADQAEIRIAGSEAFEQTARRLPVLEMARRQALGSLSRAWDERRLGDDLPALVVAELSQFPNKDVEAFLLEHLKGKGSFFDTHPPDQKRIDAARAQKSPGIFTLEGPARSLFSDFDRLARDASLTFYREILGRRVGAQNLVPTSQLVQRKEQRAEDARHMGRYFQRYLNGSSPPFLPDDAGVPPDNVSATVAELKAVRAELVSKLPEALAAQEAFEKADERLLQLARASALHRCNLRFRPADFGLPGGTAEMNAERTRLEGQRSEAAARRGPIDALVARRLTLAMRLQAAPEVAAQTSAPVSDVELVRLLSALAMSRATSAQVRKLGDSFFVTQILLANVEGSEQNEAFVGALRAAAMRWHRELTELRRQLASGIYPFDHAKGEVPLSEYLVGFVPREENLGALVETVDGFLDRFVGLQYRIFARLAFVAERVETAIGLEPLPEPLTPP